MTDAPQIDRKALTDAIAETRRDAALAGFRGVVPEFGNALDRLMRLCRLDGAWKQHLKECRSSHISNVGCGHGDNFQREATIAVAEGQHA